MDRPLLEPDHSTPSHEVHMHRALAIATSLCALTTGCELAALPAADFAMGDGGLAAADAGSGASAAQAVAELTLGPSTAPSGTGVATPAPHAIPLARQSPSGARVVTGCQLAVPSGDCDRCPTRACRQVRLSMIAPLDETEWMMFCDAGDVLEEARIACLCAGGERALCDRAAADTVLGLSVLDGMFGGRVPAIGERYRDSSGLRATVDASLHTWLARIAAPERTLRCDEPDPAIAQARYEENAQRVRRTGSCH